MPMQYITPYKETWKQQFDALARFIRPHLPAGCTIHHVGSTSVPGMPSKDIIDLDIECPIGAIREVIKCLDAFGYQHEGDKGIPGREAFKPKDESHPMAQIAHHLYACERNAFELAKHLAFRDYLIAHPTRARWLAQHKIAVDASAQSRAQYIDDKAPFYAIITHESLAWAHKSVNRASISSAEELER